MRHNAAAALANGLPSAGRLAIGARRRRWWGHGLWLHDNWPSFDGSRGIATGQCDRHHPENDKSTHVSGSILSLVSIATRIEVALFRSLYDLVDCCQNNNEPYGRRSSFCLRATTTLPYGPHIRADSRILIEARSARSLRLECRGSTWPGLWPVGRPPSPSRLRKKRKANQISPASWGRPLRE